MSVDKNNFHFLIFVLGEYKYGIKLSEIERVFRSVEITPTLSKKDNILGLVNIYGNITPVVNIRNQFGLNYRELELKDQFILIKNIKRNFIIIGDSVDGVVEIKVDIIKSNEIFPGMRYIFEIIKINSEIVLIIDTDKLISEIENEINDSL